ncbi:MAG: ADP-ribosylglycohydrolase family protein [Bifidobacteriaceae bacterium]|jgi:ADP-ribosylglycohydrolase|nr:ADP-ribosylglycohydrolase family protein [Bifidobacteriaceae bacterium]
MTGQTAALADRIGGGLAAALLGDALGSATEMLTERQVRSRYGQVTGFTAPAAGTFAAGREPGALTDDGLLTLALLERIIDRGGVITSADTAEVLLRWSSDAEVFNRFAGPSSRKAILALREGATPEIAGSPDPMGNDLRLSNGAAMKVGPAGWANPGQLDQAVSAACALCVPTHNSHVAFEGAACVAAAVAAASAGEGLSQVLEAGLAGAEKGYELGLAQAVEVPAPRIKARVELALELADGPGSAERRLRRLVGVIGSGLPITEAVPMALGLVALFGQEPIRLILAAVNLGGDSDTVASIAGAIAGTVAGLGRLDREMVGRLEEVNGIDVRRIASRAAALKRADPPTPGQGGEL